MCYPGFTGENCSINIDDCSPMILMPGKLVKGSHLVHLNKTTVEIMVSVTHHLLRALLKPPVSVPGYTGLTCETEINECLNDPCKNNGNCIDLIGWFRCLCPAGLTGDQCQIDEDL